MDNKYYSKKIEELILGIEKNENSILLVKADKTISQENKDKFIEKRREKIKQNYKEIEEIKKKLNEKPEIKQIQNKPKIIVDKPEYVPIKYNKGENTRVYQEKEYNKCQGYYENVMDTVPTYMSKNLDEMPNNKGYIWRGVWHFGKLPNEKTRDGKNSPLVMFEKRGQGVLVINEFQEGWKTVYEKKGQNKREMISQTFKKPKTKMNNIF